MLEAASTNSISNSINIVQLTKLRLRAMRAGVWFRTLSRIDRVLIELTIKVARYKVRSLTLTKNILTVMEKLEDLLEGRLSRIIREIGIPRAQQLSSWAQKWGNHSAEDWLSDVSFASFLAVVSMNEQRTFKS